MSDDFKTRLMKAKNGTKTPPYKRMFITTNQAKDYRLRFLDPKVISDDQLPFMYVYLHGGYKHPNYNQEYTGNFRCGGKGCPLCLDSRAMQKKEKDDNVAKKDKQAWKKQSRKYAIYWAINQDNKELTLVHIPDFSYSQDQETLNQIVSNKLIEFAELNLNPFDLKEGMDVIISAQAVDDKFKFKVDYDNNSKGPVEEKQVNLLRRMKALSDVYKVYKPYELDKIAKGERIEYGEERQNKEAQQEKAESATEQHSMSEESYEMDASNSSELDALLNENMSMDHLNVPEANTQSLSEKLKKLQTPYSGGKGSEDKE